MDQLQINQNNTFLFSRQFLFLPHVNLMWVLIWCWIYGMTHKFQNHEEVMRQSKTLACKIKYDSISHISISGCVHLIRNNLPSDHLQKNELNMHCKKIILNESTEHVPQSLMVTKAQISCLKQITPCTHRACCVNTQFFNEQCIICIIE